MILQNHKREAVLIILNNRTTVPYLSLPECCAVQLLKCRQEEFPSGPEECCICTEVSAEVGGWKVSHSLPVKLIHLKRQQASEKFLSC